MSRLIRLKQAVIVEGKYDKITLKNIIDATIITTDGFGIFKNKEKCDYIRRISKEKGIIVITDSDSAGFIIRSHIKNICGSSDNIINVYIPQLKGKEKRKDSPSKQGYIGLEGMSPKIIKECLKKSGINEFEEIQELKKITKNDLYILGLCGGENSSSKRNSICEYLELPTKLSTNSFLDAVNAVYGYDKFISAVKKWQQETDKN